MSLTLSYELHICSSYLGFIEGNGIAEPYPDDISWVSPAVSPALRVPLEGAE
jgi:hypothetical protein